MYYIVLPRALDFLTSYDDNIYDIQIRASYYYSFAALTLLAGGLAFLMPIFVLALVRLRVLTSDKLRKNRRIAYVVLLVFAILLPTVDPVSLAFETIPLLVLFEMSVWLSVLMISEPMKSSIPSVRASTRELWFAGGGPWCSSW